LQNPYIDSNIQNSQKYTVFHLAIIYNNFVVLQILLDYIYIDINYLDFLENSIFLLAAIIYNGRNSKRETIIDILVSYSKISVDIQNYRDCSVL